MYAGVRCHLCLFVGRIILLGALALHLYAGHCGHASRTSSVANALIMMIMGGGFISVLQGWLGDAQRLGIRDSYWVGVICFAYLAFYAYRMHFILKAKGITLENAAPAGH